MTRPYHPEARSLLAQSLQVDVWDRHIGPTKAEMLDRVAGVHALLTEGVDIVDEEIFDAGTDLLVVGNRAVGTDNLDIPAATKRGILLTNTPGILQDACADMTFGLILGTARRVPFGDREVRAGKWAYFDQTPYIGTNVYGKTLGIVGLGGIGERVAHRASGFDMRVIYHSRTRKRDIEDRMGLHWAPDLSTLLREADFVSLHMSLTPQTQGLIGKAELDAMKPDAFLINTSRGRTVDSKALYDALTSGKIAGAALDVTDPEPISPDDPLLGLQNVVITPHVGSASKETFKAMALLAAENIIAALNGQPMPSCLNPEALDYR
jgi:glyoxylate reductase